MSEFRKEPSKISQLTATLQDPEEILKALGSEARPPRPELTTAYVAPRTDRKSVV